MNVPIEIGEAETVNQPERAKMIGGQWNCRATFPTHPDNANPRRVPASP